MTIKGRNLSDWIATNLWAILALLGLGYGGYVTGTVTSEIEHKQFKDDIAETNARIDRLTARSNRVSKAEQCVQRNLDRLFDRTGIEPACQMNVPEQE